MGAVKLALVVDFFVAQGRGQHFQIFLHVARRVRVGHPEHALDDGFVGEPDTERKAAAGRGIGGRRLLRHHQRMAGVGGHHRGAELDALGGLPDEGERGHGVEPEHVRHPEGVEAELFHFLRAGDQAGDRRLGSGSGA